MLGNPLNDEYSDYSTVRTYTMCRTYGQYIVLLCMAQNVSYLAPSLCLVWGNPTPPAIIFPLLGDPIFGMFWWRQKGLLINGEWWCTENPH